MKSELTPTKHCLIIHYFLQNFTTKDIFTLLNNRLVNDSISDTTIRTYKKRIAHTIHQNVESEIEGIILDGPVEIDECLLYKPKPGYENRARPYQIKKWVVGLRCRTSGKFLIFPVKTRAFPRPSRIPDGCRVSAQENPTPALENPTMIICFTGQFL
jgi:hypothetical protein